MQAPSALLIAIEGLDGAGKSTFTRALGRALSPAFKVATVHTPGARLARIALEVRKTNADASYLAFMIGNVDAVQPFRTHELVLVDRYVISTIVHHEEVHRRWGADLNGLLQGMSALLPQLTVFLDVEIGIAKTRLDERGDTEALLLDLETQLDRYNKVLAGPIDLGFIGQLLRFPHNSAAESAAAVDGVKEHILQMAGYANKQGSRSTR